MRLECCFRKVLQKLQDCGGLKWPGEDSAPVTFRTEVPCATCRLPPCWPCRDGQEHEGSA